MKIFFILILYFLIYPIKIKFIIPVPIHMLFLPFILIKYKEIYLKNRFNFYYSLNTIFIIIISIIIILFSEYKDMYYINYYILQIMNINIAYLMVKILKKSKIKGEKALEYLLYAILLDFITVFFIKINPSCLFVINKVVFIPKESLEIINSNIYYRFLGLGGKFFGGGVIAGYGVLLSTYLYLNDFKKKYFIILVLCFFYGILLARTTIISLVLSFFMAIIVVFNKNKKKMKCISFIFKLIILIFTIYFIIYLFFRETRFGYWVLEILGIFFEKKPRSVNSLINLLENIKKVEIQDIILGNGKWKYGLEEISILRTDIGYYRILFYSGIIGFFLFLFNYIYFYCKLIKISWKIGFKNVVFSYLLLLYYMVINIKGFVTLNFIVFFILNIFLEQSKRIKKGEKYEKN